MLSPLDHLRHPGRVRRCRVAHVSYAIATSMPLRVSQGPRRRPLLWFEVVPESPLPSRGGRELHPLRLCMRRSNQQLRPGRYTLLDRCRSSSAGGAIQREIRQDGDQNSGDLPECRSGSEEGRRKLRSRHVPTHMRTWGGDRIGLRYVRRWPGRGRRKRHPGMPEQHVRPSLSRRWHTQGFRQLGKRNLNRVLWSDSLRPRHDSNSRVSGSVLSLRSPHDHIWIPHQGMDLVCRRDHIHRDWNPGGSTCFRGYGDRDALGDLGNIRT